MPRRPNINQRKILKRNIPPSPKSSSATIRSIPLTQTRPRFQICSKSRMHAPDIASCEIGYGLDLTGVLTDAAECYALAVVECTVGDVDVGWVLLEGYGVVAVVDCPAEEGYVVCVYLTMY